jgi:predicted outer membrane repeat protein
MKVYQRNAWNDFYTGSPSQTYGTSSSQIKITISGSAYVSNAVFQKISSSAAGGAIYCSDISLLFLCESTSFLNCSSSSNYGGAIYLSITGESLLYRVCGFGCVAINYYSQFDYIRVPNDVTKRNEVNYTSVCHSIQKAEYNIVIDHCYGKMRFNTVNASQNECQHNSGIFLRDQSGEGCFVVEYCSLTNNTMRYYFIIDMRTSYGKQIRFCNILNNKQQGTSSSYGLIHSSAFLTVENSCILGNDAVCQVYGSSSSVVSNCSIDFSSSKVSGITLTNLPKESFVVKIACFETASCEAFYDSYGELSFLPDQSTTNNLIMYSCEYHRRVWDGNLILELIVFVSFLVSD